MSHDTDVDGAVTMITNDEDVAEVQKKCFTKHTLKRDSNWEKVRQEVTCAICLELLDDPKSMPCLHTYCKKCLMEALTKRPHDPDLPHDRPAINCPLCRTEVALSDQGIEALATYQFLCNTFSRDSSTTRYAVPVLTSLLCQTHPQELLKLYCKDCEALFCRDCVLVEHKAHNYSFVDEIIEEEKEHLQNVTLKELEHILASTQEAITGINQLQAKVALCNDDNVAQLDKCFQEITSLLNSCKRSFLDELQKQLENLMTLKQKIESCRDFTQKTLHDGISIEIMSAKKNNPNTSRNYTTVLHWLLSLNHPQQFSTKWTK